VRPIAVRASNHLRRPVLSQTRLLDGGLRDAAQDFRIAGPTVIDEDDVSTGDRDIGQKVAVRRRPDGGDTEGEGEGVGVLPRYLQQGSAGERIDRFLNAGEPHGVAMCRVGVGWISGFRTDHFFEDQQIALAKVEDPSVVGGILFLVIGRRSMRGDVLGRVIRPIFGKSRSVDQGGCGGTPQQAALGVSPGVDGDFVLGTLKGEGVSGNFLHGLEHLKVRARDAGEVFPR
jgi:hypothetical protein